MSNLIHKCYFCKRNIFIGQFDSFEDLVLNGYCYNCGKIGGCWKYYVGLDIAGNLLLEQLGIENYGISINYMSNIITIYTISNFWEQIYTAFTTIDLTNLNEQEILQKIKLILTFQ